MLYTHIFVLYIYIYTCKIVDELTSHRQRHVMSNDVHFLNVRLCRCGQHCYWFLTPSLTASCFLMWIHVDMKRYEDTSPVRDISQHILDILKFDVLPDCSGQQLDTFGGH